MTRSGLLCVLAACVFTWASIASALTRSTIIATATDYLTVDYTITGQNTFPLAPCYTAATYPYCSHLPVGSWSGEVYGYGLIDTWDEMLAKLSAGCGAGDYKLFWDLNGSVQNCIRNHCTGIDCSGFVMRCWGMSLSRRISTVSFCEPQTFAPVVANALSVQPGDVFNSCKVNPMFPGVGHMKLFASRVVGGMFVSWEASASNGRCVALADQSYEELRQNQNYIPYVYAKVKDDPAADVFAFCAGQRHDDVVVAWETLLERDTQSFVVERSSSSSGPFVAVSDELPRRAGDDSGARYEFIDTSYPGGPVYYRLREIETSGRSLLQGDTGPVSVKSASEVR